MKLHETTTHDTPAPNPAGSTTRKIPVTETDFNHTPVELKAVLVNGHTESEPLYDDVCVQPSTITAVKNRGIDEGFAHMIKIICLLGLSEFKPGDKVDSPVLCAEIRYGLSNDEPVDDVDIAGLSEGERLDAGTVVLILAEAGELPLEPLGPNKANLQKYRVK